MAKTTKKSSSSAKTKTTKKAPVSKKSAATVKNKTASKKASIKVTAQKRSVARGSLKMVTIDKLRSLQLIAVGAYALLAAVAVSIMNSTSYQLTLGHVTKNDFLAGDAAGSFVPAVQGIYDIEIRFMLIAILILSAVMPVLYLSKLKNHYVRYLQKTRMMPFRWLDFALTGALMVQVAALLGGVSDLLTLKLIAGAVIVTGLVGLIAERQANTGSMPVRSLYYTGIFAGLLPWMLIAGYAITTVVYGMVRSPWYVYAVYAVLLFALALLAKNFRMQLRGANYLIVERNFMTINIIAKVLFAVVLIVGLAN